MTGCKYCGRDLTGVVGNCPGCEADDRLDQAEDFVYGGIRARKLRILKRGLTDIQESIERFRESLTALVARQ